MSTEITIALIGIIGTVITSLGTLVGVIVQNRKANSDMVAKIDADRRVYQARMDEKMDIIERKMDRYNNMIERTYRLETTQAVHETRLASLEAKQKILKGDRDE